MKFTNTAILLITCLCMVSCAQSRGPLTSSNVSPSVDQPQGNFNQSQPLPTSDTSFYTVGCKVAGQETSAPQVDPRLKTGMVFDNTIKEVDGNTFSFAASFEATVAYLTPNSLVESIVVKSVKGIPGMKPGLKVVADYTLQSDGTFPVAYNPSISLPTNSDCAITYDQNSGQTIAYAGHFKMTGGLTVSAKKTVVQFPGKITCAKKSLGHGTQTLISITSNDIPAEGESTFCGGVKVFTSNVIKLDNGHVVTWMSTERTGFHPSSF